MRVAKILPTEPHYTGDLTLSYDTVTGTESYEVLGTIDAGPSYTVAGTGDLSLTSGERVVLKDGFSVASGGRLSVAVDPNLGTGAHGETAFQHVERYDKHGRLYQVREPSGTDDTMITTTYSSDVAGTISAIGGQRFSKCKAAGRTRAVRAWRRAGSPGRGGRRLARRRGPHGNAHRAAADGRGRSHDRRPGRGWNRAGAVPGGGGPVPDAGLGA